MEWKLLTQYFAKNPKALKPCVHQKAVDSTAFFYFGGKWINSFDLNDDESNTNKNIFISITFFIAQEWVIHPFSFAMRHNDANGLGEAITNDIVKSREVIEFDSSCIVISFPCIYLIIDWKISITKVVKHLRNYQRLKFWARVAIAVSSYPAAAHMYRWTIWTIHPSLLSSSRKNTRVKTKTIRSIR